MSAGTAPSAPSRGRALCRALWLWTPVLAYMAAIFYVQSLSNPPSPPGLNDKFSHLLGYAGLGLVAARACAGGLGRRVSLASALTAVALVSAYGITDEIHQMFVPLRAVELLDWYADTAGALVGTAACMGWGILVHSRAR
ncbi:MAG: VanZ family protein [Vicinamibacterales bacterium]